MGRISKCRRYVIDVTVLNTLSLGELGVGVQCFVGFGASGRAKTIKIGGLSGSCTNWLDKVVFPD